MDQEETLDVSTEEETSQIESPAEEVEVDEPFEEEEEVEETSDEPQRLYADRFEDVESLEKSYKESSSQNTKLAQRLADVERKLSESNQTPEQVQLKKESMDFVRENGLVTKQDLKDERDAVTLTAKGVPQGRVDHVLESARLPKYSSMGIKQIYKEIYGNTPKKKPQSGARSRSTARTVGTKTLSRQDFGALKFGSPEYAQVESQLLSGALKLV